MISIIPRTTQLTKAIIVPGNLKNVEINNPIGIPNTHIPFIIEKTFPNFSHFS